MIDFIISRRNSPFLLDIGLKLHYLIVHADFKGPWAPFYLLLINLKTITLRIGQIQWQRKNLSGINRT